MRVYYVIKYTEWVSKIWGPGQYTLDGIPATRILVDSALGLQTEYLFAVKGGQSYIIHYYNANESELHQKEMLSTFRFLD
jgi:hypothetical protein